MPALPTARERLVAVLTHLFGELKSEADFFAALELYWEAAEVRRAIAADVRLAHLRHGAQTADAARVK